MGTGALERPRPLLGQGEAMIVFEADKKPLHFLLDQVDQRQVALPDFQRSFVWYPSDVRELLVSIFSSYPAGSLLLLQGGAQVFAPRAVETAPSLLGNPPYLVLDGQQRLTSMYQAFRGQGTHRFFLNIQDLVYNLQTGDDLDVDDAVEVFAANRCGAWADSDGQAKHLMLPLSSVRSYTNWMLDVLSRRGGDAELQAALVEVNDRVVRAFEQYQFPVTTLASSTPTDAVCSIFETLNRTGRKLSVFELLTARAFASGHRLREKWQASQAAHPILEEFEVDPYDLLQVVAVWAKGGSKRSQVLSLTPDEIVGRWDEAAGWMAQVFKLLRHECGVLAPRWLPYGPAVVTMAAVWPSIALTSGPEVGARRALFRRWFWIASFAGRYDNAATTAVAQDAQSVKLWLEGGPAPEYVTNFRFDKGRWNDVTPRQRALYRASMALLMAQGPLDFHTGHPLTQQIIQSSRVDDHHIFPKAYLARTKQEGPVDCILNRTLIDRLTNITISAKAPSAYLEDMAKAMQSEVVTSILESHHIPVQGAGAPTEDDFAAFVSARLDILEALLVDAIGRPLLPEESSPVLQPEAGGLDPEHSFREALGPLWTRVKPLLQETSVEEIEQLGVAVNRHLDGSVVHAEARRLGEEVQRLLSPWEDYDRTERTIARATAAYFLDRQDETPDLSPGGLVDDEIVIRAAAGVLGGWSPEVPSEAEGLGTSSGTSEHTATNDNSLASAFDNAMKEVYVRAKSEAGYNASVFLSMLSQHGGLDTARRLLASRHVSDGFVALWERGRLDLAVENVVLRDEFAPLFTDDERDLARQRLSEYGRTVD